MATFAVLTRLSPEALKEPGSVGQLEKAVASKLKEQCPEAKWVASYSVLGPFDYLDIYEAPDQTTASKVALVIRSFGHATTETWPLTPWDSYLKVANSLAAPRQPASSRATSRRR
jgi:uncharacterized protein with GYD domain